MRKFFHRMLALSAFLLLIAVLSGASIRKMYVQANGEYGWVFHVFSQKLPSPIKNQQPKSIMYDYTYVEQTDSVAILCTIRLSGAERIGTVGINSCDVASSTVPEMVYVQPWKNGIEYRLRTYIPFKMWEQIYDCPAPFTLSFHVASSGDTSQAYVFSIPDKQWGKNREKIVSIMNIIKLNTGK